MNMQSLIDGLGRLGLMGAIAFAVVGAIIFVAIYGVMEMPDHDLTKQAMTVLVTGAGGVLAAVGKFFGKGGS